MLYQNILHYYRNYHALSPSYCQHVLPGRGGRKTHRHNPIDLHLNIEDKYRKTGRTNFMKARGGSGILILRVEIAPDFVLREEANLVGSLLPHKCTTSPGN